MNILFTYLKQYKKLVILALLLASINQVFSLLDPYIFRKIVDVYLTHFKKYPLPDFMYGVGKFLLMAIGVAMVSRIAKNFQDYYSNVITQSLGARIYSDGIKHSLELPYTVFEDQRSGETLGILTKLRSDSERMITAFISVLFTSLISILFVGIYAFTIYWPIAPVYLATIPILGIISYSLSNRIKAIQKTIVAETTSLAGSTTESLRNIELVKSLGLGDQEIKRLNGITGKILKLELKKVKYIRSLSFIQGTCVNLLRNGLLLMLVYLTFIQKITIGEFFSLYFYSFQIFGPLQELGNIINIYRETEASLENFKRIMAIPVEVKPLNPILLGPLESLKFEDVSFRHQTGNRNALTDISFTVNAGETIAFAGPSGSGKTTLVKLLVGLYKSLSGQITYNNLNPDVVDMDALRERIGFVTQDTQLFSGSIRENLLFVKPGADDEQCLDVLQKASCQGLLARAENGLDTLIGEGGVKVSGGEKQRLSIARALLRNPRIMIFDEATSSLDSLTEEEISKTIREVSTGQEHITVLIAHRLSTIMHADRIYVLERGRIAESGAHAELLHLKGLYYAMWRQQIGENVEEVFA